MSRGPGLSPCSVSARSPLRFYNGPRAVLRESRTGVDQEEVQDMLLRRLIALAGLALFATIAIGPAGALAAAKGTDRPLKGTTTGSLTVSLPSGPRPAALPAISRTSERPPAATLRQSRSRVRPRSPIRERILSWRRTATKCSLPLPDRGCLRPLPPSRAPRSTRSPAEPGALLTPAEPLR
jgi:hypothetical protein